ncbi:MAG: DUF4097 family beta strand repeat-containing protein [Anaerolineae bacterium]
MRRLGIDSHFAVRVLVIGLMVAGLAGCASQESARTEDLSVPLGGAKSAAVMIDAGDGNLTVDPMSDEGQELANGTLGYAESQGLPRHHLEIGSNQAVLTLQAGSVERSGFRWPWEVCGLGTYWQVNLNSTVISQLKAHSNGGNITLNLAGMPLTSVTAETGGGNLEVVLPNNTADLTVTGKTGAGNVVVRIPNGAAARIHATTGLGKVTIDPQFNVMQGDIYQSPGYDSASAKVELTLESGAGDVVVKVY